VVGPAVARNAWPARIARDGTAHVNTTDSIWAFELCHRAADVAARLGVPAVRFAAGPLPRQDTPEDVAEPLPEPTAQQASAAAAIAAPIDDEKLRETVQKAVLSGLLRQAVDRPVW